MLPRPKTNSVISSIKPALTGTIGGMSEAKFARVAVPVPLFGLFDYRLEKHQQSVAIGCRVEVSFGRKSLVGLVMETCQNSQLAANKIKAIGKVIDETPVLPKQQLKLQIGRAHV